MGDYSFDNLSLNVNEYESVICDKNFLKSATNILPLAFKEAKAYILEHYESKNILYVVTGSPFFFSAGILIAKKLPKKFVKIIDNTSSKTYMQAHCFISDADMGVVSIHGRPQIDLEIFLTKPYTFVLCDKESIKKIKDATSYLKNKDIEVTIGYKLGYADERIEVINIKNMDNSFDLTQPYILLIKRIFTPKPTVSSDDDFVTERGMITKQYKRHLILQNLDLAPNQILWDIGAGSGSCGIEAYKRYKVRTTLFEKQSLRCDYIRQNLTAHYVCDTQLLEGNAEELFEEVKQDPQRIFVGGGGEKVIARLPYLYERLCNNGVMLIVAITLKNLTQMIGVLNSAKIEYHVISLSLTTYKGKLDLIEPQRQMFQIKVTKK